MINNNFRIFILLTLFSSAAFFAFADDPSSSLDDKPSVDTAAVSSGVQVPAVPADTSTANVSASYLYDLKKLINKSRENIKQVNEKIKEQAVLKRNQKREERAREYYEKGVELTNEGKLDEARDYFEKAIRITEHPEMAGYIKESQERLRRQENALQAQEDQHHHQIKVDENIRKEDVEAAYRAAVDLYKQKKYHPAKDAFEHVDEIAPDYRATSSYLKIIDQDIILADAAAVKQQAVEIQRQQKEAEAARAKEKAMWLAQLEEKEKERKESIDKQAQEVYDEAVILYTKKRFAEAKKKFEEVSWVIPDYKKTMWYLGRIDRDAQAEQARVAAEQQKALQQQRWEEAVDNKKHEAERQQELKVKDAEHLKELEDQADFLYAAAVKLFDSNQMDKALEKFTDIENTCPGFRSTTAYIARIRQWQLQYEPQKVTQQEPATAAPASAGGTSELTLEQRRAQQLKDLTAQAQSVYDLAVQSYRAHLWGESRAQFETVEKIIPDFKHTRHYLDKLDSIIPPNAPEINPATVLPPAVIKPALSLEDQQKQAEDIAAMVDRSAQLYREVAGIADDNKPIQQTEKKIAQVNEILNSLKLSKDRLLRQMRQDTWKHHQEEIMAESEKMYEDALAYIRAHDYKNAKIKFQELENYNSNYRSTRHYITLIEQDQKQASAEAFKNYEKYQSGQLKALQDKASAEETARLQKEQQEAQVIAQQQDVEIQNLAQKASAINDEIIQLSRVQDYEGMKQKFTELEDTVTALTTLKDEMNKEKDRQERDKQLAHESVMHSQEILLAKQAEDRQMQDYADQEPRLHDHQVLSPLPADTEEYKRHEITQEQNILFNEAVDRYEHKKYTQAKLLFGELADQHDRRADPWLKKVDRAITQELLRSQEGEEKERTAFIADQLKAQRELIIIQERERERQKHLTEELERQKRLYEDDHLLQLRKEEALKVQERERDLQEQKRAQLEKENEQEQEKYRFHKIAAIVQKSAPKPAPVPAPQPAPVPVSKIAVPPGVNPDKIKTQEDLSNQRQIYLEKQYKKEQEEKARQAKIKAIQDAREKRIEDRQKQREAQKQLKLQREQERQARIKAEADAKAERDRVEAEKLVQEKIMREETARRDELQRQERQRQAQLEAQREAVRKELEDGVEAMYQEAMSLYKQGQFTAAADKFKDVQDILPDYKRAQQYMDDARQRSFTQNNQAVSTPSSTADEPLPVPAPEPSPVAEPPSPAASEPSPAASAASTVSHQDSVSKALDLFDPNVK